MLPLLPVRTFVAKYSAGGALQYATAFEAANTSNWPRVSAIACDDAGNAYVGGSWSGAANVNPAFPGNPPGTIAAAQLRGSYTFVAKLAPDASHLVWASFLGSGTQWEDSVSGIALDSSGNIYWTGGTSAPDLPVTPNAIQPSASAGGGPTPFVSELSPDGLHFLAISYLGGSRDASSRGLTITANGPVVLGTTDSPDFPLNSALDSSPAASLAAFFASSDVGNTWAPQQGAPIAGKAIWADPIHPGTLLALGSQSYLTYRSTDYGATWTTLQNGGPTFATASNGSKLYMMSENGVMVSTDSGATWTMVTAGLVGRDYSTATGLSVNPQNPSDIVAICLSTTWRSVDGGVTFTSFPYSYPRPSDWSLSPLSTMTDLSGNILFISASAMWRTTDRGTTWTQPNSRPMNYMFAVAQSPSNPSVVYAAALGASDLILYKSTDLGATWTTVSTLKSPPAAMAVSPGDPNSLYISDATGNLFLSTDGGATSSLIGMPPDLNTVTGLAIAPDSSRLYLLAQQPQSAFIAKLNASFTTSLWSTLYSDNVTGIAGSLTSSDVWITGVNAGNAGFSTTGSGPQGTNTILLAKISDATPGCSYSLTPQSRTIYSTQTLSAAVTAPSGCTWSASSDSSWIRIVHGASGTGSGIISAQVVANTTNATRTGSITVAGQTLTVQEPGAYCTYTVPASIAVPAAGGSVTVSVVAPAGCVWDTGAPSGIAAVTANASGAGNGTVTLNVAPNNNISVANSGIMVAGRSVDVVRQASTSQTLYGTALQFIPVTPCRVVDTRNPNASLGGPAFGLAQTRSFPVSQSNCNIPSNAAAYSVNITAVPAGPLGYLTVWPAGDAQPFVSTLNSLDGRVKANAAIVPAGSNGEISVYATDPTHLVIDINGYFLQTPAMNGLAFYPLPPCRVADTRDASYGQFGPPSLAGGTPRSFPVSQSSCNIPASAKAYSLNLTVVPKTGVMHYLTMWPTDQTQPVVSTLNAEKGQTVANAAIVPAAADGSISAFATNDTDLVIDVNGYFAASGTGGLSLYATPPCRALDTRNFGGSAFTGVLTVNPTSTGCSVPATAQAYTFNATVVPTGVLHYLTLWPDGGTQAVVSTLNAEDGAITSNMAIVPASNGKVDAYVTNSTHLVLDMSSYFAP